MKTKLCGRDLKFGDSEQISRMEELYQIDVFVKSKKVLDVINTIGTSILNIQDPYIKLHYTNMLNIIEHDINTFKGTLEEVKESFNVLNNYLGKNNENMSCQ